MHRAHHGQLPVTFNQHLVRIENMHSHKLRSTKSKTFYSKQGKTKQYRGWITYAGVDHWSEINLSLKDLSLKTFSLQIEKDILQSY